MCCQQSLKATLEVEKKCKEITEKDKDNTEAEERKRNQNKGGFKQFASP